MSYVELHCHSAYSFLDGASLPEELVATAAKLGYDTLALTDHNGVFGSMEHEQAARALGLRAIHGAEVDVTDPVGDKHGAGTRHLTLLVQDARGWRNLCHLLTRAHKHTRAPDGGRVILAPSVPMSDVLEHAEGLICLSGCARQGVRDEPSLRRLLDAFGPDRFRVELQRPFLRHDRALNRGLSSLAGRLGVPCVATGNVHAHSRERGRLQDAFVAIREHATLDASEPLRRGNHTHVLAAPASMAARFADHPDAVAETARLAERLRFDLGADLGYRYPGADDADADHELAERCWAAFGARYPEDHTLRGEAHARLNEELRVIRSLGLSGFFVLHADLLELAREVAVEVRGPSTARGMLPPGRGRGSSVSSIVCYLAGLSHVDPIENELFLGRFLNEDITALPDIDLDFPRDVREVLIPRVHERYGSEHAALVAAFPTYRSRGAIREIGKALGLPPGEIERVAKVAEPWAQSVEEDVELALGAAAEAAAGTGTNRAASAGTDHAGATRPGFDATSPAAMPSGAVASGAGARPAGQGAAASGARPAGQGAAASGAGARAAAQAASAAAMTGAGTRPKPLRWDPQPDRGPSPPGPPPWTPEAGRRALQEGQAKRAESRSTPAQMGAVARTRFGGPDTTMQQSTSFADGGGFHDAYGDTRARTARTARTAINHGDKGWEPPAGDGSGRSLAGTGGAAGQAGAGGGGGAAGRAGAGGTAGQPGAGGGGGAAGRAGAGGTPGAPTGAGAQAAGASGALQGRWGWLAGLAQEAYGLPRHLSQHPGGMIVSTRPLIDCVPLVPAAMAGRQMCHWDKDSCADAGFLKIDLLGLGMLSAVERCVEEIARVRSERIDLSRIPFDDKPTYAAIQAADTMGVFQIESRAQMQSLLRTRPENLDDLTIQVAIVRPGPIVGGAVNPYIDRKQKLRANPHFQIPYDHPSLEPVLKDTLGTIIFQDQVIEVAQAFAGFSPGEAEGLRRAMSRKRSAAAMEAHHERFVQGAAATHGADRETAERVFQMVAGFSGFGFPKAHGAAFGLLAYQSTWLRVHYKPEFTAALLNEQPMGFYPSDTLVHEAQRTGIEVRAPDVNASRVLCHVEDPGPTAAAGSRDQDRPRISGSIPVSRAGAGGGRGRAAVRIGLGYLNGARAVEVATIVAEREAAGPYRSLGELASRSGVSRQALSVLAWSGACDGLIGAGTESARRTALWRLGMAAPAAKAGDGSQLALPLELPDAPPLAPLQAWERMVADYATTGLTAGPHPMALARDVLPADVASSADLTRLRHGARLRIGGLVVARQRPATANGIVFMLLEDEHGTINLVVPPETYDRDRLVVRGEPLVFAEGRLEKHPKAAGAINIVVDRLRPLDLGPADNGVADVVRLSVAARADGSGGHDELADADPVEPWMPAVAAAGGAWPGPGGAGASGPGGGAGRRDGPDGERGARRGGREGERGGDVRDFAAVAPPVQSFGQGRR